MFTWKNFLIVMGVLAFCAWHPVTRPIVWFILPLGTKPDDLVFCLVWSAVILWGVSLPRLKSIFKKEEK